MDQQAVQIWTDLIDRLILTSQRESIIYLFTLPDSGLIVHAQKLSCEYMNLQYVGQGIVVEQIQPQQHEGLLIQIQANQQNEFQSLHCSKDGETVSIITKKTSDINDLFKSYICLFTNLRLDCIPEILTQYYAMIDETEQSEILFQVDNNEVTEIAEPEPEQKQQKKQTKKPTKPQQQIDAFSKLQNVFKNQRNLYKDQIDQIGKVTQFRHPPLIKVGIFIPQPQKKYPGLQIVDSDELPTQISTEWVTYHKYDNPPKIIIEDHLKGLKKSAQNLYYSDQTIIPLLNLEDEYFVLKHKQPQSSRLIAQAYKFQKAIQQKGEKLYNVHSYLSSGRGDGQRFTIRGDYVFHHYMQDGFDDKGWGCAYRSFMTVLSWLIENGHTKQQKIPTHKDIQTMLVQMEDKSAEFIGSCEWIGAFEVSMLINKLTDIDSKILHISNGPDIVDKLHEFKNHFITQGSPIMFGGGVYAYTLLGIDYNQANQCKFLILDPHYIASDNIKTVIDKGGISWRGVDMFLPNTFYNFCMPQVQ